MFLSANNLLNRVYQLVKIQISSEKQLIPSCELCNSAENQTCKISYLQFASFISGEAVSDKSGMNQVSEILVGLRIFFFFAKLLNKPHIKLGLLNGILVLMQCSLLTYVP